MVKINMDLVAKSARERQKRDESKEKYVGRQTHLMLQGKNVTDMSGLTHCPLKSCTTIYLYDNRIRCIQGLNNLAGLRDLYLQNNELEEIDNIFFCRGLERLHLENNRISAISGLDQCENLQELNLAGQRLACNQAFCFQPESLRALSYTLGLLDLSGCNVVDPSPLGVLRACSNLNLSNNRIEHIEALAEMVPPMQRLEQLNLSHNPVCSANRMRQNVLMWGPGLHVLDEKEVLPSERAFLAHLEKRLEQEGQQQQIEQMKEQAQLTAEMDSVQVSSSHELHVVHENM